MDIRQGDLLVINPGLGSEASYPVRAVEDWTDDKANSPSFKSLATLDCKTQRGVSSGGRTGAPQDNLTGLKCLPIMPVDAQLAARSGLESLQESHQTIIADASGFVVLVLSESKRGS